MAYYRLYSLDESNHHILDVDDFDESCDATAISRVNLDLPGVIGELWNLGRKVSEFPHKVQPPILASTLSRLVAPARRWRWNPLDKHCQLVGNEGRPTLPLAG